ncbi:ATP-dependent phosphofructokinase / diphosphate-dependent phosphofructokinase, partial [Candidatus Hakubella thermalkaliphila]
NDLSETDFTFGFDTASTTSMEALERLRDTAKSHRRIMVLEVKGRRISKVKIYLGG